MRSKRIFTTICIVIGVMLLIPFFSFASTEGEQDDLLNEPNVVSEGEKIIFEADTNGESDNVELENNLEAWDDVASANEMGTENNEGLENSGEIENNAGLENNSESENNTSLGGNSVGDSGTEIIDNHSHSYDYGTVIKEATCAEVGKIKYKCTVENCIEEYEEDIPVKEHVEGEREIYYRREPTTTTSGIEAWRVACINCGTILDSGGKQIDPLLEEKELKKTNTYCHKNKHTYNGKGEYITAPTIYSGGVRVNYCVLCNAKKVSIVPKLTKLGAEDDIAEHKDCKHIFDGGTVILAPTSTDYGYTKYTCINCGDTSTIKIEPCPDNGKEPSTKESSVNGKEPSTKESSANDKETSDIKSPVNDQASSVKESHTHNYNQETIVTESTCKTDGLKKLTCECGDAITEVIKGECDYELIDERTVDCEHNGMQCKRCKRCGNYQITTIYTEGHNYINNICSKCGLRKENECKHTWAEPTFTWADDYSSCTLTTYCTKNRSHVVTEVCNNVIVTDTEPTKCMSSKYRLYEALFNKVVDTGAYKNIFMGRVDHKYEIAEKLTPEECLKTMVNHVKCTECGEVVEAIKGSPGHCFKNGKCIYCDLLEPTSEDVDNKATGMTKTPDKTQLESTTNNIAPGTVASDDTSDNATPSNAASDDTSDNATPSNAASDDTRDNVAHGTATGNTQNDASPTKDNKTTINTPSSTNSKEDNNNELETMKSSYSAGSEGNDVDRCPEENITDYFINAGFDESTAKKIADLLTEYNSQGVADFNADEVKKTDETSDTDSAEERISALEAKVSQLLSTIEMLNNMIAQLLSKFV